MKSAVLIITENFPNVAEPYRGIYVLEQLRQIAKEYNVHVLVPINIATRQASSLLLQNREKREGSVHVYYLKYPYFPAERIVRSIEGFNRRLHRNLLLRLLLRKAERLNRSFSFKLVHGHEIMVGDLAVPIGEAMGIKTMFTIHSLFEENIQYFGADAMQSVVKNLQRADQLIAVSSLARDGYAERIDKAKIKVVYNGLDTGKMQEEGFRENKGIVLLSVCSLAALKKIDLVLKALKDIKLSGIDFRYQIAGGGPDGVYRSLIRDLGLQEQVQLLGPVPPERLYQYYRDSDIFVLPSVHESFGIVFLEAMYCGKPVICSSNSGIAELIESGKQGFIVRPNDVVDLKEKILELIRNEELRQTMGCAGRELAASYAIEKQANKILSIYRSLTETAQS